MEMENFDRVMGLNFDWHNPTSSKLTRAVREKNLREVKRLLNKGMSPNFPDNRGYTSLHEASTNDNNLEIVKILVDSGAYVEHRTVEGETPLLLACTYSCEKIIEYYLSLGCHVNAGNLDGVTPLHVACSKRNYNIVKKLLDAGANINAKDNEILTPLFYAIQFGDLTNVKMLLERNCDAEIADYFSRTPLQFACMVGNLEIFDTLVDHLGLSKQLVNQQTPSDGWTLLMEAVQYKNYKIAEKLISYGADTSLVDSRKLLALHLAAHCSNHNCLELIIRHTPIDTIEQYATPSTDLTHTRSLPCLLIDKNMFEGLKLLFESGLSDNVLSCPARMGDNLVSPTSFLFLHGDRVDAQEKVKYLELLLSKEALKDPGYNDITTIRSADALIRSHKADHDSCSCELMLSMLMNEGVDPDVPKIAQIPQPFVNAISSNYIRGLCFLLSHSNVVELEDLLMYSIENLSRTNIEMMMFLVRFSTDVKNAYSRMADVMNSVSQDVFTKMLPIFQMLKTKAFNVQSLKKLSRMCIRKQLRVAVRDDVKRFRNSILSLDLPRALLDYMLYQKLLSYPS